MDDSLWVKCKRKNHFWPLFVFSASNWTKLYAIIISIRASCWIFPRGKICLKCRNYPLCIFSVLYFLIELPPDLKWWWLSTIYIKWGCLQGVFAHIIQLGIFKKLIETDWKSLTRGQSKSNHVWLRSIKAFNFYSI